MPLCLLVCCYSGTAGLYPNSSAFTGAFTGTYSALSFEGFCLWLLSYLCVSLLSCCSPFAVQTALSTAVFPPAPGSWITDCSRRAPTTRPSLSGTWGSSTPKCAPCMATPAGSRTSNMTPIRGYWWPQALMETWSSGTPTGTWLCSPHGLSEAH